MLTEEDIIDDLWRKYPQSKYRIYNAFVYDWESDFWFLNRTGYGVEIEIKTSHEDFKRDFNKIQKHSVLKNGFYFRPEFDSPVNVSRRPNKFYYCCPEWVIKIDEVPDYAGLMWVGPNGNIRTIKEAPFLHKEKQKYEPVLCLKYYHYWIQERIEQRKLKYDRDYYKKQYEQLCKANSAALAFSQTVTSF